MTIHDACNDARCSRDAQQAALMATSRSLRLVRSIALVVGLLASISALANDVAWNALASGGQVVLIRHTITTAGVGDPPGMRLDDCSSQRNLSDEGRRHAREIGDAFRARRIAIDRVLSSPWCRCLETARLAFGKTETEAALGNLFGRPDQTTSRVAAMRKLVYAHRGSGNLILVSHGSTIAALTGVSLAPGEFVVLSTRSDGAFQVVGRLVAYRE